MTVGLGRMVILRMVSAIPALFGVLVVIFIALRVLPGDPAAVFASSSSATQQDVAELRKQLHLDRPLPEQFTLYLADLAKGDLGSSLSTGRPVAADLAERLPASVELIALSFTLTLVGGTALGVIAALRQGTWADCVIRLICSIWITLPAFVTGLLLVYLFYFLVGWAPAPTGRLDMFAIPPPTVTGLLLVDSLLARDAEAFRSALGQLVLPVLTLTFYALPPIARVTRASMIGVLSSDYIRTARSLGLSSSRIVVVYGLRNALLPVLATLGTTVASLLGGSVIVEKIFAWPGICAYATDALLSGDFAPVQGFIVLVALLYLLFNLAIDILSSIADPRISA